MLLEFGIKDIIDIVLVALMLYYIYRLMRESRSANAFKGIMVFVIVWLFVSQVLAMRLLGTILDKLAGVGLLALIVIFQEEIRKFLANLGGHQRMQALKRFFTSSKEKDKDSREVKQMIMPLVMASINMSRQKVGALVVLERGATLDDVVGQLFDRGTVIPSLGRIAAVFHELTGCLINLEDIRKILYQSLPHCISAAFSV